MAESERAADEVKLVGLLLIWALFLTGCGASSDSAPSPAADKAADAAYAQNVQQLAAIAREADQDFRKGKADDAAALIEKGEPISSQVLAVLHPTLEATEAASDLDDLYGRMLLSNKHYVWAQTLFQKNVARWKYWQPATPDTVRRRKLAEEEVAECDKKILSHP